ncbi:MAG: alpha/beta hydrolase [Flavobacteriaceae bacterium]|nr:alpha/beta hydrolase [Flavobacteriaceae bacterium]
MRIFLILLALTNSLILFSQEKAPKAPKGYLNNTTLKISYFFGRLKLIDNDFPIPENIVKYSDIVYKTIDSTDLKLDIYHLKNRTKPAPLLIFIHGGGWEKGDKQDYLRYLVDFAKKGYITATIAYRFVDKVKMPGQILDIKSAVIWLKEHAAKYNIDRDNIAVIGGSAGGHLALMVGYSSDNPDFKSVEDSSFSSRVQAVVDFYGPTDLTTKYAREHVTTRGAFNESYDENPKIYAQASPLPYISKDDPPTLIFHGTIDDLVPVNQSDRLEAKLKKYGVPVEYHRLKGWPHTMDATVKVNKYSQYYMNQFFEKYIPIKN